MKLIIIKWSNKKWPIKWKCGIDDTVNKSLITIVIDDLLCIKLGDFVRICIRVR